MKPRFFPTILLLATLALALPVRAATQAEIKDVTLNGQIKDNKARLIIEADLSGVSPGREPFIFATALQHSIRASLEKLSHSFRLQIDVIQGAAKEIPLVLTGGGQIRRVTGDGLQDWSIREEAGGNRSLVLRPKPSEKPLERLVFEIQAEERMQPNLCPFTPLTIAPQPAALFNGYVRVDYPPDLEVQAITPTGLTPIGLDYLPAELRDLTNAPGATPLAFRFQGAAYALPLAVTVADPEVRQVVLRNFQLAGQISERQAAFTLTATARVKNPKGGSIELLSGEVALTAAESNPDWRLRYQDGRFIWTTDKPGEYPLRLQFHAAVREENGWSRLNFRVAPGTIQPVTLAGLPAETQFRFSGAARPERQGGQFVSFLPPDGSVNVAWKTARPETEGRLFYSAEMLSQLAVSPGLLRQTAWLDLKIMQGELNRLELRLEGDGEVTRVQGSPVLAWNVEPVPNTTERRLVIQFNQAQKDQCALQIQTQMPLGAFPQTVAPPRLRPEGATRFAGYLRIVNDGAVRLEVTRAIGLSQIAPEQFPESDATKALLSAGGSQRFVYRFSGAEFQLQLQADNILPELNVSTLLAYQFGETELAIDAELEVDIREAPLRELMLRVPRGYALARLTASGLSDYFSRDDENQSASELRLVYGQPVTGRQLVQLRLERNRAAVETNWALPSVWVDKAKSLRGFVGIAADAGFRLSPAATQGLTEIATAFFPRKVPNLQAAFRIVEPGWQAAMRVERLPQSIQADVTHLFSVGEGIAYGSSVMNYLISGAPISTLRVELSAEYFNVEFTGKDIRSWQKTPTGYTVQLHSPVAGAYALLATYERPFPAQGATLAFTGARPADAQSEQGHTLVISTHQFQVRPVNVSPGLIPLEPAEVPAEHRLLFDAPILAAYRYVARPFNLQLELKPLVQGETLSQVVDRAVLNTRISKEGQVVTDARYFIKNRGLPNLRVLLPPGLELWSATVNGSTVVPVRDGPANLIALPQRTDPNAIQQLDLKLAARSANARRVTIEAPVLTAPVLLAEWKVNPDTGQRLVFRGGTLEPAQAAPDNTGFGQLAALFRGGRAGEAMAGALAALLLLPIAIWAWKWSSRPGVYKFSAPHVAGALLGLFAFAAVLVLSANLANQAMRHHPPSSGELTFLAPVQQGGGALRLEIGNYADRLTPWTFIQRAWPAVLALVSWLYAGLSSRPMRKPVALMLGWILACWTALRWPYGSPGFFLLLALFLLVHVFWPAVRRFRLMPVKPPPLPTAGAGPAVAVALAIFGAFLFSPQNHAQAQAPAPTTNAWITSLPESVIQDIRVESRFVHAVAKVRWHAARDQRLPVLYEPAVLTRIVFPTNALQLVRFSGGPRHGQSLVAREAGIFDIEIHYQLQIGRKDGISGFALPTQPGLLNQVNLALNNLEVELVAPDAVSITPDSRSNATNTLGTLVLRPVADAWIGWRPRSRDPSREKPAFYAELRQLYLPSPGVIESLHYTQLRPSQGALSAVHFRVPAGLTVTDVLDSAGGEPAREAQNEAKPKATPVLVSDWRFDPDTRRLRVLLRAPQTNTFALVIKAQIATGPLPFEQAIGLIAVEEAAGQLGLAGIATSPEVQLDQVAAEGLSPINLEDFPALPPAVLPAQAGLTLRRAYRYADPAMTFTLKASPVEPDVRVETQETLSLGEDRTVLAANLAVEITRAGIFRLSFMLPSGMDIESISGEALSHWTELKTADGRLITLHLRGKTEGRQSFMITLAGPGLKAAQSLAAPKLLLREASKQRGQLVVVPEQGMRLQVSARDNLTQLDPQKAGIQQKGVLAFRILSGDWSLRFDVEQVPPWVQVSSLQQVTVGEAQLEVAANLQYQIENTGLKTLAVSLPANAENARFSGEQIADFQPAAGPTNTPAKTWEVKLHRRVIGSYLLQVRYRIRLAENATQAQIVSVRAENVNLQRGFLTIQGSGRLQARIDQPPPALQPAEWQAIPRALQQDLKPASANYTFRLVEPAFTLPLTLERHEVTRLLPARVQSMTLSSVISDDGEMLTQARIELVPGDKRLLRLQLPAKARFWFASVNQSSVWPWLDQGAYLIPLEQQSRTAEAIAVEIFYSSQTALTKVRPEDFELLGPKFDLPLENITWRVFMNEQWRLRDWSGTLQLREQSLMTPRVAVDFRSYLQQENQLKQEKSKEAEQLLSLGNALIQQGDPQQARRALQAAYGISSHDAAFNEDARVQLHNLKLQQALVGLNARQAAGPHETGAAVEQLRKLRDRPSPAYSQTEAQQMIEKNSADDNAALTRVAERIIQQQEAAVTAPAAIRASIPEQGRLLVFSRAMQVDTTGDLRLKLEVSPQCNAAGISRFGFLAGLLVLFSVLARLANGFKASANR